MLELRQVDKRFGSKTILEVFSLSLQPGKTTCLLGPSGCGKTTLLRLASGLIQPDSGDVLYPASARASFVFQEDRLLPWYDAEENLKSVGIPSSAAEKALADVLLGDDAHTLPEAMSGGMRRRLAIARALAFPAEFYFLDEPLRGLDAATAAPVLERMRNTLRGKTALLITHRPEEALALGDVLLRVEGPPLRVAGRAGATDFADMEALTQWLQESSRG